jgi:hypothetical protein
MGRKISFKFPNHFSILQIDLKSIQFKFWMTPNCKIKHESMHQHNKIWSGMNISNIIIYWLNNFWCFYSLQKQDVTYTSLKIVAPQNLGMDRRPHTGRSAAAPFQRGVSWSSAPRWRGQKRVPAGDPGLGGMTRQPRARGRRTASIWEGGGSMASNCLVAHRFVLFTDGDEGGTTACPFSRNGELWWETSFLYLPHARNSAVTCPCQNLLR